MLRKNPLVIGETYHIFNRSIAEFQIFNTDHDFRRIVAVMQYYQAKNHHFKFSHFIKSKELNLTDIINDNIKDKEKIVDIISYCVMPTHIHLILRQLSDSGISIFMNNVLNSYSKYFNIKHNRKGPLWEGRFKSILVDNEEYLLHLTRYIHLNPTTASLIDNPGLWKASSYHEYISEKKTNNRICRYQHILEIKSEHYKKFVEDQISYQKELAKIKHLLLE